MPGRLRRWLDGDEHEHEPTFRPAVTFAVRGRLWCPCGWTCADGGLAFEGDRIAASGRWRDVGVGLDPDLPAIDARDALVVPGLTDCHTHFQKGALARFGGLHFLDLAPDSPSEVLRLVAEAARGKAPGSWLRGDGLNGYRLRPPQLVDRRGLDDVAPDVAVVLFGVGNHVAVANSLALARAGIDATTPDPPGGRLERLPDGSPSGVLHELGKLRLDPNRPDCVLPRSSIEARVAAVEEAQESLVRQGLTAIHDVVVDHDELEAYATLLAGRRLRVRIRLLVRIHESRFSLEELLDEGIRSGSGGRWLKVTAGKISVDGAVGGGSAALHEPYPAPLEGDGALRIDPDRLVELIIQGHRAGFASAVHGIGQRAVDIAMDAFDQVFRLLGRGRLRHRIEHAYLPPRPGQVRRLGRLGLIVSTQPAFLEEIDELAAVWPLEQLANMLPIRSLLRAGIGVCGGSDYPYVSSDPAVGIRAAVTRRTRHGETLGPRYAISTWQALRLFTSGAALASDETDRLGALERGHYADVSILDPAALAAATARADPGIGVEAMARATVVAGVVQHGSELVVPLRTLR
jgi:predicted amidohydrolase YtcJ